MKGGNKKMEGIEGEYQKKVEGVLEIRRQLNGWRKEP
jgi:hypothetical protein